MFVGRGGKKQYQEKAFRINKKRRSRDFWGLKISFSSSSHSHNSTTIFYFYFSCLSKSTRQLLVVRMKISFAQGLNCCWFRSTSASTLLLTRSKSLFFFGAGVDEDQIFMAIFSHFFPLRLLYCKLSHTPASSSAAREDIKDLQLRLRDLFMAAVEDVSEMGRNFTRKSRTSASFWLAEGESCSSPHHNRRTL